ncbi:alkaline phosphatase family protein [Roseateles sp. SL47]|uniref:alkaline phosphatase family protein n=1 Tax=Roseateles sp. SL47 TaxID=2995138 RepID=UPI00226EB055|nr:alkaline phosphatase family protein [Roseateles sp. SL47]WAC73584.1 alkaline phosphatase family protein [Roseateles sp. SL47]
MLLADGLRADTARDYMGYLHALHDAGRAQWAELRCEMPSLSRPLYATLLNGEPPLAHGILGNGHAGQVGQALPRHLFQVLQAQGLRSAVAAYHWFYELLSGEVFDPTRHRDALPAGTGIVGARWYWEDDYPDSHLLADAESLRSTHAPSLLFVHPMGPDLAGHVHGGESTAYAMSARKLDMLLAQYLPRWHAAGYDLLLTSDHGMNADRMHGGPLSVEREVPLIWVPHDAGAAGGVGGVAAASAAGASDAAGDADADGAAGIADTAATAVDGRGAEAASRADDKSHRAAPPALRPPLPKRQTEIAAWVLMQLGLTPPDSMKAFRA